MSEERFRIFVDGVHEYSIILLVREGIVTGWNAGAECPKDTRPRKSSGDRLRRFICPRTLQPASR